MWHVCGRREMHTAFKCGNPKDGDYWEDPDINERIILKLF
jgi:hypothetical protein